MSFCSLGGAATPRNFLIESQLICYHNCCIATDLSAWTFTGGSCRTGVSGYIDTAPGTLSISVSGWEDLLCGLFTLCSIEQCLWIKYMYVGYRYKSCRKTQCNMFTITYTQWMVEKQLHNAFACILSQVTFCSAAPASPPSLLPDVLWLVLHRMFNVTFPLLFHSHNPCSSQEQGLRPA